MSVMNKACGNDGMDQGGGGKTGITKNFMGNCSILEFLHPKIKSRGVDEHCRGYHQSDRQKYNMEGNKRTKIPITGDTNSPTDATVAVATVLVLAAQVASGVKSGYGKCCNISNTH